jgi:hypothetical protein
MFDLRATFARPSRDRRATAVTGRGPQIIFLCFFGVFLLGVFSVGFLSTFFFDFGSLLAPFWTPFGSFGVCFFDVFLACEKRCSEEGFWRYSGPRPPFKIVFWHTQASVW